MGAAVAGRRETHLSGDDGSARRSGAQVVARGQAPSRTLARVAGALLITATAASVIGTGLLRPVIGSAGYLAEVAAHQDRVSTGVFFELVAAFSCTGIAVALYPVVRRHNAALALGAVAFRTIEGTLDVVGAIGALLLLKLSQEYGAAADPASASFQTTGALLRTLRDQAALSGTFAFYLGAAMYYYVFYRSRLLPRWLTGWGLAGVALGALAGLLVLFGVTGFLSTPQVALNVPIGVNEIVLAIWLIVRGFTAGRPAGEPDPAAPSMKQATEDPYLEHRRSSSVSAHSS